MVFGRPVVVHSSGISVEPRAGAGSKPHRGAAKFFEFRSLKTVSYMGTPCTYCMINLCIYIYIIYIYNIYIYMYIICVYIYVYVHIYIFKY